MFSIHQETLRQNSFTFTTVSGCQELQVTVLLQAIMYKDGWKCTQWTATPFSDYKQSKNAVSEHYICYWSNVKR